jgi:hypothetical protein
MPPLDLHTALKVFIDSLRPRNNPGLPKNATLSVEYIADKLEELLRNNPPAPQQPSPIAQPTPTPTPQLTPTPPPPPPPPNKKETILNWMWPTDVIGLGVGIGGRIANAYYKTKAARQIARGNAAQHLAAAMSTPQSQAVYGSPLSGIAKISADAGQSNAAKSLATGEAWQGSLSDISNFISSINVMRRLMKGNAMSAMAFEAMRRFLQGRGGGTR